MDLASFNASLQSDTSPPDTTPLLQALWLEAKGDWHGAHEIVQSTDGEDACWVHAYLHRVEGDLSNARYWYRRAGKAEVDSPLKEEWSTLVHNFVD